MLRTGCQHRRLALLGSRLHRKLEVRILAEVPLLFFLKKRSMEKSVHRCVNTNGKHHTCAFAVRRAKGQRVGKHTHKQLQHVVVGTFHHFPTLCDSKDSMCVCVCVFVCVLRAACCVLRAACCVLRAACCVLHAACCVLRAA